MSKRAARMINALANHLERHVTDDEFDIRSFGYVGECGVIGCAAYHATNMPIFQKRGLRLRKKRLGTSEFQVQYPVHNPMGFEVGYEAGANAVLHAMDLLTGTGESLNKAEIALHNLFIAADLKAQTRTEVVKRLRDIAKFKCLQA